MAKKSKKRKNTFEKILLQTGLFLINTLSQKQVKNLLNFIAVNVGYRIGIRKKLVKTQIKRCFPEFKQSEINDITKRMYQNYGLMIYEILKSDKDALVKTFEIEGEEHYQAATNYKGSYIISSGHYGNWEMMGHYLIQNGMKLSAVAKKQRNPYFDKFFVDFRQNLGLDLIYQKGAMRGIIKAIRADRKILLVIDQDGRKSGEIMPFLGHDASVFMGVARIAIKTKIPIVPMYHVRTKEGKHKLVVEKMIFPNQENLTDIEVMTILNQSLENMIRRYPELWFWVHKRWKSVDRSKGIRY